MNKQYKKPNGFTLLEVVISAGILLFISSIMIANYRVGGSQSELAFSAQQLASDIRTAQDYALGGKTYYDDSNNEQSPYGWGVYLNKAGKYYNLFYEKDYQNNYSYSISEKFPAESPDKIFSGGIYIDSILVGVSSVSSLSFGFSIPDAKIYYGVQELSDKEIIIILKNQRGDEKTVTINPVGLVEVK